METVSVNRKKCNGCGLCVQVCPHRLFAVTAGAASVTAEGCMGCGHCQAVCPSGAVEIDGLPAALDFRHIPEKLEALAPGSYDCGSLVQLIRSRRSCRNYTSRRVELDLLEDLVKVGTTAPSGTNSQSWNFVILPERQDVEILGGLTADFYRRLNRQAANPLYRLLARFVAGDALGRYYRNYYASVAGAIREWDEHRIDRLFHGAVAAILVTGSREAGCPGEDAVLATQNILLAAHALGLGSCLIGFAVEAMRRDRRIKKVMAIPGDEEIYTVIALGYPAFRYQRVSGRRPVHPRVLHLAAGRRAAGENDRMAERQVGDDHS